MPHFLSWVQSDSKLQQHLLNFLGNFQDSPFILYEFSDVYWSTIKIFTTCMQIPPAQSLPLRQAQEKWFPRHPSICPKLVPTRYTSVLTLTSTRSRWYLKMRRLFRSGSGHTSTRNEMWLRFLKRLTENRNAWKYRTRALTNHKEVCCTT